MPDTPSTSSLPWGAGLNANSTYDLATKVAAATVSLTPSVAGSSPAGSIAASQGYYSTTGLHSGLRSIEDANPLALISSILALILGCSNV